MKGDHPIATEKVDGRLPVAEGADLDTQALRARYALERQKRLRADGNAQYQALAEIDARFDADPHATPGISREAQIQACDVVIVGGGFGGLLIAERLKRAGVADIWIVEKGGDFGGTWYWNRYPGAACDIESYIYLPLLEETDYLPVEKYSKGPEILAHCQRIGRRFDLYRSALFQTTVTSVSWDDASKRWAVCTDKGDRLTSRFVVISAGFLHKAKLPAIPGIQRFAGRSFHTSRWDYGYTGGGPTGGLTGLAGKRVGLVGTGATAVQCLPHLAASAKHVLVFQRTPSSVDARNNRPTDPQWARTLQPGWQKKRMENFNALVTGAAQDEDLVNDGWTKILRDFSLLGGRNRADRSDGGEDHLQMADFLKMEKIRARVDSIVRDPHTARSLKPYFNLFCKRPCFHDDYLDTFNRSNVTLVDTEGRGINQISSAGIIVNDSEYPLDCIVFATGFEFGTDFVHRVGFDIRGRDHLLLSHKWRDGAATLHGMLTKGFPNLLIASPFQAGYTHNATHILAEQADHIAYLVTHSRENGWSRIEPAASAESGWTETIVAMGAKQRKFLEECTPGFYNNEGQMNHRAARNAIYGGGAIAFIKLLADWRESGGLAGLDRS